MRGVGGIQESKRALGTALKGKVAVFIVEDSFVEHAAVLLKHATLPETRLSEQSKVIGYPELSSEGTKADILIVQTPLHGDAMDGMIKALGKFRQDNPDAAVIICAFHNDVISQLEPLRDSGVVNFIETRIANDFYLLGKAAEVLRLQ